MMRNNRRWKTAALTTVVALGLTLTSCYVPPDDLSNDIETMGNQTGLWNEIEPTQAPTQAPTQVPTLEPESTAEPYAAETPSPGQQGGTATGQLAPITNPPVWTSTNTPRPVNTIAVYTNVPKTDAPQQGGSATPKPSATGSLKNGSSGNDVRAVQRRLKELGYYTGSVDGDFGQATEKAVIAFQQANKLEVDGKVGASTLAKLNSSSAVAARPASATAAPQTGTLEKGDEGDAVRVVQRRLRDLKYYTGSVDGSFGSSTESAVRAFQRANGLTVDGRVGANTLAKLNSSNAVAAGQTAVTAAPTAKPTATPKPTAVPQATATPRTDVYMELDDSNKNVRRLQERLIELGYLTGQADGYYGGSTETAVRAFQAATKGLYEDGKAGPLTLEKLYSNSASKAKTVAAPIGYVLELGAQGNDVKCLQSRLRELGYLSASADGSYGSNTAAAVMAFQQVNGLKADGKAGEKTLNLLFASTASKVTATPKPQTGAASDSQVTTTGYTTLRLNDEGDEVRKLQRALKDAGLYKGSVDGVYGTGTMDAVSNFQRIMDLKVDGKAGPATQRALYNTGGASIEYATLRPGDSGSAVTNLQYTLYELGYFDDTVNGYYGQTTQDAVWAFQSRNDIPKVDGVAGNKTQQKLYSSTAVGASKKATTYTKVKLGDVGETVLALRIRLNKLGYPVSRSSNVYDEDTRQAVLLFQKYNGLKVDGIAGQDTQTALYSEHAVRNPE